MKNLYKIMGLLTVMLMPMQVDSQEVKKDTWILYKANDSIDMYYQISDCNIPSEGIYRSYLLFRFVNKTNVDLNVDWYYKTWFGSTCYGCTANEEFHRQIKIKANSTMESTCEKRINELTLFRRFLSYSTDEVLTDFEFYNIKIFTDVE